MWHAWVFLGDVVRPFEYWFSKLTTPKMIMNSYFGMHATAFANKDSNLIGTIYGNQPSSFSTKTQSRGCMWWVGVFKLNKRKPIKCQDIDGFSISFLSFKFKKYKDVLFIYILHTSKHILSFSWIGNWLNSSLRLNITNLNIYLVLHYLKFKIML